MTKEAMKLALELKNSASGYWTEKEISIIEKLIDALAQPEQTTGNILMDSYKAMQSMKVEGPRHVVCQCDKCKAQPEQEPCDMGVACAGCSLRNEDGSCPYAKPEQEPVVSVQQAYAMAQVCLDLHDALGCKWGDNVYLTISKLKAAAQPEQEPVAWLDEEKKIIYWHNTHTTDDYHGFKRTTPLYTTPPQRTWVELSDEELSEFDVDPVEANLMIAKLKEKNT